MNILNNDYGIDNLLTIEYDTDKFQNDTLLFSILYLTSNNFRGSQKQSIYIQKYKNQLLDAIEIILEKSTKLSKSISTFNKNIVNDLKNEETKIEKNIENIIFIFENVLTEKYNVIIFENGIVQPFTLKSSLPILLIENEKNIFKPIVSKSQFIFKTNSSIIKIIQLNNKKENTGNTSIYSQTTNVLRDDIMIIEEDDIIFEELESSTTVSYNNQNYIEYVSEEDSLMYLQNLTNIITDEFVVENMFYILQNTYFNQKSDKQIYFDKHLMLSTDLIKSTIINQYTYLDNFEKYKKLFPHKAYIESIYSQEDDIPKKNPIVNDCNTIINPLSVNEEIVITSNQYSCLDDFTLGQLHDISKYHDLQIINTKSKLCKYLSSVNLLNDEISQKLSETLSTQDIKDHISKYELKDNSSKNVVIKHIIANNLYDSDIISINSELIKEVNKKYNLSLQEDSDIETLTKFNFLNLYNDIIDKDLYSDLLDEHDNIFINTEPIEYENPNILSNKVLAEDNFFSNGFILLNDIYSKEKINVFHLDEYIENLRNIEDFLPVKCKIYYFNKYKSNSQNSVGEIKAIINNSYLEIQCDDNNVILYNLLNIKDNYFFLYSDIHDNYHYDKTNIQDNVFVLSNKLSYDEIKKIILLSFDEYIFNFPPSSKMTIKDMNKYLYNAFNLSVDDLLLSQYKKIEEYILIDSKKNNDETINKFNDMMIPYTPKSFINFDFNIGTFDSDINRLIYLNNNYWKIIDNNLKERSFNEEIPSTNQINITETNIAYKEAFSSYEEIKTFKEKYNELLENETNKILIKRINELKEFVDNEEVVNKKQNLLVQEYVDFHKSINTKIFLEPYHVIKHIDPKKYEGMVDIKDYISQNSFVSTLENPAPSKDDDSLLGNLIKLIGIQLSDAEKKFIQKQSSGIFIPLLVKLKQKTSLKKNPNKPVFENKEEEQKWLNSTLILTLCGFILLITQLKMNVVKLFSACKKNFSLYGYPLEEENNTEKGLLKYIACVIYTTFGKKHKNFSSPQFIQNQIEGIVELIFNKNPELKQKFSNLTKKTTKTDKLNYQSNLKPFIDSSTTKQIYTKIQKGIINKNFSITLINDDNKIDLFDLQKLFQIKKPKKQIKPEISIEKQKNIQFLKSSENENVKDETVPTETIDEISNLINDFEIYFNLDLEKFKEIFIVSQDENVDKFIKDLTFNDILIKIKSIPYFEEKNIKSILTKYTTKNTNKRLLNVFNMLKNITLLIRDLFDTENIYTFIDNELNQQKKNAFNDIINIIQEKIKVINNKYELSKINKEQLENIANILKEKKKQEKLTKYKNMDEDQAFIVSQLEQMIGIEINNVNQDDIDNEKLDVTTSDD
jgi:hypothetical protein